MTSRQQHNDLNANTNPRENFKKIFSEKNLKKFREKATQSGPGFAAGTPSQYFLPLKISCPKKAPFCDFSDFEHFYIPFRIFLILPNFFVHFRNRGVHFRNFWVRNWARNPRIYRNGRGRDICSDFVFILFILGNMIQKTEFVYYCRKKVKKSIAIKKNVVSLQSDLVPLHTDTHKKNI